MGERKIIEELRSKLLAMEDRRAENELIRLGLGGIESAFPKGVFPRAAVHELISHTCEAAACTNGFITMLLSSLLRQNGRCMWISEVRTVYPPALSAFGIHPDRLLFVEVKRQRDALWVIEEAMKCEGLTTVVAELPELDFQSSRRLQLAVERSRVTGFIHRHQPRSENAVACVSRWAITPLKSETPGGMPGLGFPRWHVELLKARNGRTGKWNIECSPAGIRYLDNATELIQLKTGSHD